MLLAVVAIVAAGCGGDDAGSEAGPDSGELQDVSSVGVVARDFDAGRGTARLVLLLSPT